MFSFLKKTTSPTPQNDSMSHSPNGSIEDKDPQAAIEVLKKEQDIYDDSNGGKVSTDRFQDVGFSKAALLLDVINQMKSGKDLYRISLPAAFISPVSLLEYVLQFIIPNKYIFEINEIDDPMQRMITVTKWFFSNLCHLPRKGFMHCKPYNPILGEIFRTKLFHPENDSETWYFAEQVSHHPPVSACWLRNEKAGITLHLTLIPRSKFHGNSVSTIMDGGIEVKLDKFGETYKVQSFPWILARSLIWGAQCLELWQFLKIKCEETNIYCKTEFFWKQNNTMKGKIRENGKKKKIISGSIIDTVYISNTGSSEKKVLLNAKEPLSFKIYKYVPPVYTLAKNESRRVWHHCSKQIYDNNYSNANKEKSYVEDVQRKIRKKREKKGIKHQPTYFVKNDSSYFPSINAKFDEKEGVKSIESLFKATEDELQFLKANLPKFYEKTSKKLQKEKEIGEA